MIVVLAMAAALWGIGMAMRAPVSARLTMIGVLLVAVLAVQVALPAGHPLREATGGSPALWLMIAAFGGVGWGYARLLRQLRQRAEVVQDPPPARNGTFSEAELERYARHIVLREIGGPGQKALHEARVLIIGAGGLGCPAALYLAGAGVGTIGIIDDDVVEASNLQRQVLFRDAQLGMPKVFAAEASLNALNPHITVRPYQRRLTAEIAEDLFADYDLVIDGTDSYAVRALSNRAALARGIPLIAAAITAWEGQIGLFDPASGGPCYHCLFPNAPDPALVPGCAEAGVLGPLPGVMGTMAATEAIKHLTGAGQTISDGILIFDARYGETHKVRAARNPDCEVCGPGAA